MSSRRILCVRQPPICLGRRIFYMRQHNCTTGAHLLYGVIHLSFGVHALYTGWPAQTGFGELSPSRPPARNSLRQCSVRGTHAAVPTATSPLPLRRGYKKRPAVSHDRSLILLMVFNKRTRDVNPRLKILSCATNDCAYQMNH